MVSATPLVDTNEVLLVSDGACVASLDRVNKIITVQRYNTVDATVAMVEINVDHTATTVSICGPKASEIKPNERKLKAMADSREYMRNFGERKKKWGK